MAEQATLLLVDDEPGILKHLAIHLGNREYTIRTAQSAEAALTILAGERIDLLLSDLRLPGMNGLELLARAKSLHPTLQCILLTGHGDIETAVEAMKLGAINYLLKPMNMTELELAIANGLEKKRLLEEVGQKREELLASNRQLQQEISIRLQAETELRQAHAELERRVEARTAALARSNQTLQAEIRERQQLATQLHLTQFCVDNAAEPIFQTDQSGKFSYVNTATCLLSGYQGEELLRMHARELLDPPTAPADRPDPLPLITEATLRTKSGVKLAVEVAVKRWRYQECEFNWAFVRDISARKQAQAEAEEQARQLIQADKLVALGTLVSSIGHEISNPNNFILLNIPLLKTSWEGITHILEGHYRTHGDFHVGHLPYSELRTIMPVTIDDLLHGAQRIKKIIAELRHYARPAPKNNLETEVRINEVVEGAITLLRHFLHQRTASFRLDCGQELPTFRANPQRIEQVIINLLRNAGEALTDRSQEISLRTSFNQQEQAIAIEIGDGGSGIDPHALAKLAHPFYSTKHESGGLGLGLSICTRIVQSHGGSLHFASHPGQGTVVTAQFPVATTVPLGAYR